MCMEHVDDVMDISPWLSCHPATYARFAGGIKNWLMGTSEG